MLVLTRRPGESLRIETPGGEVVIVRFMKKFRVGVDAPRTCAIVRGELAKAELPAPIAQPKKRRKTGTTRAA